MYLLWRLGIVLIATLLDIAQCTQDTGESLSFRDLSTDDYTDLYTRELNDLEDSDLFARNLEDTDIDSLLSTFSRRELPPAMPIAKNTPQDIQSLCTKPLPTAQDFTVFFSRSGFPSNKSLFWSGIKDSVAMEIGAKLQRITLEMMLKPNNTPLPGCDKGMTGPNGQLWWNAASEGFGDWSTESVAVVFSEKRYAEIRDGKSLSTWVRVELPALWKKFTAKIGAVMSGAYTGIQQTIANLAQRLKGLRGDSMQQQSQPSTPPLVENQQQQAKRVFDSIQMYICDANGGNLQAPKSYDGPVPVSGNAPGVEKTARR